MNEEGDSMPSGRIKSLVHLSEQTHLPNTRLVPDHNDQGYGIIEDDAGRKVYFSPEVVEDPYDFEDLQRGQRLEYTLENAPYLRAASVRVPPAPVPAA
jgi:cold shock CspA family protein